MLKYYGYITEQYFLEKNVKGEIMKKCKTFEEQLKAIENNLNNRPKKVLGYRTPKEQMTQEINNHKG